MRELKMPKMQRSNIQRNRLVAGVSAALLLLAACGDDGDDTAAQPTTTEAPEGEPAGIEFAPDSSLTAQARDEVSQVAVYPEPPEPDTPEPTEQCVSWEAEAQPCLLDNPKVVDDQGTASPLVFLVDSLDADAAAVTHPEVGEMPLARSDTDGLAVEGEWLPVWLPFPPNENTGFVSTDNVNLYVHSYRITIDREAFMLTLTESGEPIIETQVGLGRAGADTRPGFYYTTELLQSPNPDSVYGPFAYGISGFAEDPNIIEQFGGEDGVAVVGIHGTNQPELIGQAVSAGCIRVPNDVIIQMADPNSDPRLPLGIPVEVS
jgi:lipoprotein-anchoring transpeptidase ErfK/SrfK